MAEHTKLIEQFLDITGTEEERAWFYLESAAWQLDIALASFFENDGSADHQSGDMDDNPVEVPVSTQSSASNPEPSASSRNLRPRPVEQLNHKLMEVSSSESDSDDDGQAFYVGGSERSGQQVIGPRRKKEGANDLIGEMFKSAKDHGAEVVEKGATTSKRNPVFKGTGYRLGQSDVDTQVIPGEREPEAPRSVTLKLWKTGFSLDEGPVRDYHNPSNKEFLEYIKRGEVPLELIREARGREVHLQMEDHRTEEFISKKSRFQAFRGEGHALGNPTPDVVSSVPSTAGAAAAPVDLNTAESNAKTDLNVQESEPTTNVQIRLADGSRLIGHFNHTHTIGHIRQYIRTARPQYSNQSFALLTTYPSRELGDDLVNLKDASLLNATIMQRMK